MPHSSSSTVAQKYLKKKELKILADIYFYENKSAIMTFKNRANSMVTQLGMLLPKHVIQNTKKGWHITLWHISLSRSSCNRVIFLNINSLLKYYTFFSISGSLWNLVHPLRNISSKLATCNEVDFSNPLWWAFTVSSKNGGKSAITNMSTAGGVWSHTPLWKECQKTLVN